MGLVLPNNGFLKALRKICSDNDALLIFDEVMTGFRLAKGGAQEIYNVTPDITTLGKVIGGGSARWCLRWKVRNYEFTCSYWSSIPSWYPFWKSSCNASRIICIKKLDNKLFQN